MVSSVGPPLLCPTSCVTTEISVHCFQYPSVGVFVASKCDFELENHRTMSSLGDTKDSLELYNIQNMDGTKYIEFTPLCLAVEFYGPLTFSDSFVTNSATLEITILNPNNRPSMYLASNGSRLIFLADLTNVLFSNAPQTSTIMMLHPWRI